MAIVEIRSFGTHSKTWTTKQKECQICNIPRCQCTLGEKVRVVAQKSVVIAQQCVRWYSFSLRQPLVLVHHYPLQQLNSRKLFRSSFRSVRKLGTKNPQCLTLTTIAAYVTSARHHRSLLHRTRGSPSLKYTRHIVCGEGTWKTNISLFNSQYKKETRTYSL